MVNYKGRSPGFFGTMCPANPDPCNIVKQLKGSRKKGVLLVARPLRPYPPSLELSGHIFWEGFFRASKKLFFLVARPLRGGGHVLVTKKIPFF